MEADLSSLDSQDRNDIESCRLTVQGDTSMVRTEMSEQEQRARHEEQYDFKKSFDKHGANPLAKSEKIKSSSSKSSTCYNYLNNRMSVRI